MGGISIAPCQNHPDDAKLVMDWRNDPVTLAMSYHQAPKVWDSFWPEYRDVYFATAPVPAFARMDGRAIAFLRFVPHDDPGGKGRACVEISINLAPAERGRGLGTIILNAASDYLAGLGIGAIYAEVRIGNPASQRAFEAAGYRALEPGEKLVEDTGELASILRYVMDLD